MIGMSPKKGEVLSLMALLSNPKEAKAYLEKIVIANGKHAEALKEAQIAHSAANHRLKEAAALEQKLHVERDRQKEKASELDNREFVLSDRATAFEERAERMSAELNSRSLEQESRHESIARRESEIGQKEAQATIHLDDAKALEKHWLEKMARFNALAKE